MFIILRLTVITQINFTLKISEMEYNNDVLQMVHSCTRIFCMYVSLKRFNVFLENSWRVESARQMFSFICT